MCPGKLGQFLHQQGACQRKENASALEMANNKNCINKVRETFQEAFFGNMMDEEKQFTLCKLDHTWQPNRELESSLVDLGCPPHLPKPQIQTDLLNTLEDTTPLNDSTPMLKHPNVHKLINQPKQPELAPPRTVPHQAMTTAAMNTPSQNYSYPGPVTCPATTKVRMNTG
jgi:hypothetical protein